MDFLARRNHSELELRQKLSRTYHRDDVEDAIAFAKENNWMANPEELAGRVAIELGRKQKGHRYINQFLKQKGLPPVSKDSESELEKALEVIQSKRRGRTDAITYEEQTKLYRWLSTRGFDEATIRQAISDTIRKAIKSTKELTHEEP